MADLQEIWKAVPAFGNFYEASSLGRIRSLNRSVIINRRGHSYCYKYKGKILSQYVDPDGYKAVGLGYEGKTKSYKVHRMIAMAFYGMPPADKPLCLHNDGSRDNNIPSNLRWGNFLENMQDRTKHGYCAKADKSVRAKVTWDIVNYIRTSSKSSESLAKEICLGATQIRNIRNFICWKPELTK